MNNNLHKAPTSVPADRVEANYSHTQVGYILRIGLCAGALFYLVLLLFNLGTTMNVVSGIVVAFLFLIGWVFGSLTVQVTPTTLKWYFGPGFWNKSIERDQIESVRAMRTKWWYGFGIRLTPHGWLYNVQGLDAVQVTDTTGKTTLIGTDEPEALVRALNPTP